MHSAPIVNHTAAPGRPGQSFDRLRAPLWRALGALPGIVALALAPLAPARAADYTVNPDASGNFASIQACADAARPGDTCIVYPGIYNEHVKTVTGGTGESSRITFTARGQVTMQGFDIRHPYVTVSGFDITGYSLSYYGLITVFYGGNHCSISNNVIRDGAANVIGLYFYSTSGQTASHCTVSGNRLSNLGYYFLVTNGTAHLFQNNTFEYQNSMDYVRLFGADHVFRRNVFWKGTVRSGTGNHPDFAQTFGSATSMSQNHLFEENWIQDLPGQFAQLNSGDGVPTKGVLYPNIKDVTFRRNIIVSIQGNGNASMPGVRFENNTIYRLAYELSGIGYGGSLTRGDGSRGTLKNNVFLAGGARASGTNDSAGFYSVSGAAFSKEVISVFVTKETDSSGPITSGLFDDLRSNGYIDSNGIVLSKAYALTDISQFVVSPAYAAYKQACYDHLLKTVQLDDSLRSTFYADYNFVAGAQSAGFPAKRSSGCTGGGTGYTAWNFCEPHGVNGGDPKLADLSNVLGPDGLPFTLDDGLKPLPGSPLCAKGEGGTDIGAYSCDPTKVFVGDTALLPPTDLKVVK